MKTEGPERAAKPQHFDDPAVDALYQMVLVLGEEFAALREQLDTMRALHDQGTAPSGAAMDAFQPNADYDRIRQRFVERLLEPLRDIAERESSGE